MEDILALISTYGLSIVMCVVLSWLLKKISDDHKENIKQITNSYTHQIEELTREYNEKVEGFTNAVNNNTKAMEKLIELSEVRRNG